MFLGWDSHGGTFPSWSLMIDVRQPGRLVLWLTAVLSNGSVLTRLWSLTSPVTPRPRQRLVLCLGIAARETAQALKTLAQAARGVAASTTDPKAAAAMLDSARDVMEGSALLIHEAKEALGSPGDAESQQRLAQVRFGGGFLTLRWIRDELVEDGAHSSATVLFQVAKAVSHSLNNCVNCLPGQKDVDMALKSIGEASKKLLIDTVSLKSQYNIRFIIISKMEVLFSFFFFLSSLQIPPSSKSFQEAQSDLNQTAADLNQSAGEVVHASRGSSNQLAVASGKFSHDFDDFLDAGIEMAGHTQVSAAAGSDLVQTTSSTSVWLYETFVLVCRKRTTRCRWSGIWRTSPWPPVNSCWLRRASLWTQRQRTPRTCWLLLPGGFIFIFNYY